MEDKIRETEDALQEAAEALNVGAVRRLAAEGHNFDATVAMDKLHQVCRLLHERLESLGG